MLEIDGQGQAQASGLEQDREEARHTTTATAGQRGNEEVVVEPGQILAKLRDQVPVRWVGDAVTVSAFGRVRAAEAQCGSVVLGQAVGTEGNECGPAQAAGFRASYAL